MRFGVGVSRAETGAGGDSRSPAEVEPLELREVTTDLRDQLPESDTRISLRCLWLLGLRPGWDGAAVALAVLFL